MEDAFDLMGFLARERGMTLEIAVYGGSCLVLASDIRNASADVDAVFLANRDSIYEILKMVAIRKRLPEDWLNQSVKRLAPPPGNPEPNLIPFGCYPRSGEGLPGLRVFLPTPEYMLAMKIFANRSADDTAKIQTDTSDAVSLMRITGIAEKHRLLDLLRECYPHVPGIVEPRVNPRIEQKIESLLDAYRRNEDELDPTWNAGRGSATRPPR